MQDERCPGCGATFPAIDGPTHAYMLSSPGCWAAYGEVLAREYADPALFAACHRLTVDAYAVQHPGDPNERRAVRSVWLHFAALDAVLSAEASHDAARTVLQGLSGRTFPALPPMPVMPITVRHVADADPAYHVRRVAEWAAASHAT